LNGESNKRKRTESFYHVKNEEKMSPHSSTKTMAMKFEALCGGIYIGILSKQVDVMNSPVSSPLLVQFGSGKLKKCMTYVHHWERDMHGSTSGRTGTRLINGNFGQDLRIWNIILSFRRTRQ
jgi:hypothetical protein